ncbi:MAG: alpha-amylase family glycosyl hydrolase [Rhizomicrobium sp.]
MSAATPCATRPFRRPSAGTFAGLGHRAVVRHLRDLGVTAVELLPVHPIATPRRLWQDGLVDYWGYNPINFFALEPRYLSTGDRAEFAGMVHAFHDAGIEVILDVVLNHTGEVDEFGPTLSFRGIDNASYYCLGADKRRYLDFNRLPQHAQPFPSARGADGDGFAAALGGDDGQSTGSASISRSAWRGGAPLFPPTWRSSRASRRIRPLPRRS